jgi:PhnB protein
MVMAAKKAAKKAKKAKKAVSTGSAKSSRKSPAKSARPAARKVAAKSRRAAAGGSRRVKSIPDGYHSVTPYLIISNAASAIDFYKRAFGAAERMRMGGPDGRVGHAELEFGNAVVMLADEFQERGHRSPKTLGGTTGSILIYVDDVDDVFDRAIRSGARELQPVTNQFYGDRSGSLEDPFGHQWTIATHVEDVSPEEMNRRMASMQP